MAENKQDKATIDKKDLTTDRASQKVELDLDDAPFLIEEKEEEKKEEKKEPEKSVAEEPERPSEEKERSKRPIWKKWWFWVGVGLVIVGAVFFILNPFKSKPSKELEKKKQKPKEIVKPEKPPEPPKEIVTLSPFWLEYIQKKKTRWLHAQFMLVVSGRFVVWEINKKKPVLRDAIYYYFKNKDLSFLTDKKNVKKIKNDLKTILNQYLDKGKIEKILIQKYLLE